VLDSLADWAKRVRKRQLKGFVFLLRQYSGKFRKSMKPYQVSSNLAFLSLHASRIAL
jgi:prenyltransferase beta subunit